jgi:hypothetical protein
MMTFHLKTFLSLLLLGFVLGFVTAFLFMGCNKNPTLKKETVVTPKVLKKEAIAIEENYQKQIASLQDQNMELQQDLEVNQGVLDQAKEVTKQLENKIKKLIEPAGYPAKRLIEKVKASEISSDLPHCDSLINVVSDYIEENHRKDSIYELQIIQMDSVVSIKDDLIQTNAEAYCNLHQLFEQSVVSQENLIKENTQLRKQFKRQRFKNKLVTAGLMILSATATNYLLHH